MRMKNNPYLLTFLIKWCTICTNQSVFREEKIILQNISFTIIACNPSLITLRHSPLITHESIHMKTPVSCLVPWLVCIKLFPYQHNITQIFPIRRIEQIMKDTILQVEISFIMDNPRIEETCLSAVITLKCKEILFFLKTVIWLAVRHWFETNHHVLKWHMTTRISLSVHPWVMSREYRPHLTKLWFFLLK